MNRTQRNRLARLKCRPQRLRVKPLVFFGDVHIPKGTVLGPRSIVVMPAEAQMAMRYPVLWPWWMRRKA